MLYLILHWVVSAFALIVTAYLVRGFKVASFGSALGAAAAIGLVNALVRPFLLFITFPISILTLGLFVFVVNGIVIRLSAALMPGFEVKGWGAAIFGALVLAVTDAGLHYLLI
jgi:putative membrane protein